MLEHLCYVVAAYLIGSIPFGYLAGKMNGIDLREHGSKNIGATNSVRVLGKKWGIPVFVGDFLKGYLPLFFVISQMGGNLLQMDVVSMSWVIAVLFSLVLGHTFTIFLGFKGGKGVATTAGCLFALSPVVGFSALVAWILCMVVTRYVSLSSMVAGAAMLVSALWGFWWQDGACSAADAVLLGLLVVIFILVFLKHTSNIKRLLAGTEPKAFSKK